MRRLDVVVVMSRRPRHIREKGLMDMAKSGNKPVKEVRIGAIKAVIWLNETQNGERHNVQLQRIYKVPYYYYPTQ